MTIFWWRKRRDLERENQEARDALEEAKATRAYVEAKVSEPQGLYRRIHELRRENHISDAVRHLLEGS